MAAGKTYDPIATTTLSSAGTITFSSIPATYTDLVLVTRVGAVTSGDDIRFEFNGDSTAGAYNWTVASANGTGTKVSTRNTSQTAGLMDYNAYPSTTVGEHVGILYLNSYASNKYKSYMARSIVAKSGHGVDYVFGQWRNTAAINSIKIGIGTGYTNLAVGTIATLFGIAAA